MATHLLFLILAAISPLCAAQESAVADMTLEEAIAGGSHASVDLTGNGQSILLTYSSKLPFKTYVLFLHKNGSFLSEDVIVQILEAGENEAASIDLSRSPGWKPNLSDYRLHFLAEEGDVPIFQKAIFIKTPLWNYPIIMVKQLLHTQAYTPSIYHRLTGRHILGVSLTMLLGLVFIICCIFLLLTHRQQLAIRLCVTVSLLFSVLTSFDLLSYIGHVHEWKMSGTYGTAGSLFQSAAIVNAENTSGVLLCTDDNSYAPTLLSYYLYPALLVTENPSHIVVHHAVGSLFSQGMLSCSGQTFAAQEMAKFSDGTAVYRTQVLQ